ncbi:ABC transporter ATP-binding protein [Rhizobium sp. L51/94]|uniref:ABC transporter ATP-binding protein n=1 Tax=Rhizobium sp. L51/94 TaxID=2819999 RepID=UPI001C5B1DE7|nr:ABC transporter ATP-binding protein [Rhizobium sp. L51/94]QXZ80907.1 ABC transporter ATP-binding protein [Rhizobium sp. L51/94]
MTSINLKNVSVEIPVFNASSRSLKNHIVNVATGGSIARSSGVVTIKAIDDLSIAIGDGERVGIVGHNGAGKTTLLRVLSGIYVPTNGSAQITGKCVSLINIGLGIDPEATGRDNIRLRAAMMGLGLKELSRQFEDIAEFSGLGGFLDMPFRTYSSGMQLRLAFSVSTAIRPEILIMDEWLSTGDEDFRIKANARLQAVVNSTRILILASHSRDLLLTHCDRVIWLEHGRLKMDGPCAPVLDAYFNGG